MKKLLSLLFFSFSLVANKPCPQKNEKSELLNKYVNSSVAYSKQAYKNITESTLANKVRFPLGVCCLAASFNDFNYRNNRIKTSVYFIAGYVLAEPELMKAKEAIVKLFKK